MTRVSSAVLVVGFALLGLTSAASAATDPVLLCHKTVVKQLEKYKKTHLKLYRNCLDKQNRGDISGPCLDAVSAAKLGLATTKVTEAIAKKCTMGHLTTIGYRSDCQYGAASPGIGGTCAALPVTNATEFAQCMECWKGAEFSRVVATLYASHAQEVCGAALDNTSTSCSAVGCTTPLPTQRDLGNSGENDCQRAIAKAGMNYLLKREKFLEQCLLKGGTRTSCLNDGKLQLKLAKAEAQKETAIKNKCGNRDPVANPPFCCRMGTGNSCILAADRAACVTGGGTVQEGKTCDAGTLKCTNPPGGNLITWWDACPVPGVPCPGPTPGTLDGLVDCVDDVADSTVDILLCLQFPNIEGCAPLPTATPNPTPTSTP
jgi:hypothetical protein